MKKLMALILGLSMMLGIAACGKKVEVPSKSDVKKAAAEEYDMDFKVDSEDISDDEKEAEWELVSKDGSLKVTVTWNAKNPDEFEFDSEENPDATETEPVVTTDEPTTTTTEEPTTTTTEATTASSGDESGEPSANPNPSGAKYVNFDDMSFYINGKKYTLGKTTLQDLIDDGVPFKDGELENAKNNLNSKYQSAPIRLKIADGWTVSVYVFNDSDSGKPMNECYLNEISVYTSSSTKPQSVLTFDFPYDTLTIDELKANSGEPTEKPYHNEDDPKFVADYLEYTKKSTKYMNRNRYKFEFYNGKLNSFYMTYIP